MVFEADVDELDGSVNERIAVLAKIDQVGVFTLQVFKKLSCGV